MTDLILDTHVFLWWDGGSPRLAAKAATAIADPANVVFVSAASIWEIAIKRRLGKLAFTGSAADATGKNGFLELPISASDAELAGDLPWRHTDPFDRLLVAQAQSRSMTLVTADPQVADWGEVATIPAV